MVDDSSTCFHGGTAYEDCNNRSWMQNSLVRYYGGGDCKWWHFFPDEGIKELKEKFNEIIGGQSSYYALLQNALKG